MSGTGTNLQALLDAATDDSYGATVVAVGADRAATPAIERAAAVGVPTFVVDLAEFADRAAWDDALTAAVAASFARPRGVGRVHEVGRRGFPGAFRWSRDEHAPGLSPAFPGVHAPRDAVAYGVKVSGCTLFFVDDGVDTGPIVAQASVAVHDDDDESALHERIKVVERRLLVETVGMMARAGWTISGRKVTIP